MTIRNLIQVPVATVLGLSLALATANGAEPQSVRVSAHAPETQEIVALTYPDDHTISIELRGTSRLLDANGEAKVERKRGATEVEIELDEMKPAHLFGGDYNTYVLWAVSPQGQADNLGEFLLAGNRSKLNVTTPLESFGLIVTPSLIQVAGVLGLARGFRLSIEGHADNTGERDYNLDLSPRRAGAGLDYLLSQGISSAIVSTKAYGEDRPDCLQRDGTRPAAEPARGDRGGRASGVHHHHHESDGIALEARSLTGNRRGRGARLIHCE